LGEPFRESGSGVCPERHRERLGRDLALRRVGDDVERFGDVHPSWYARTETTMLKNLV